MSVSISKLSQVTRLSRYDNLSGTVMNSFTDTVYDDTHRTETILHRNSLGSVIRRTIYEYDSASRVVDLVDLGGTPYESYEYDDAGQLVSVDYTYQADESFSYDGTGNRTNTGYSTGENNQTTSDGTYDYDYDAEGNRIKKTTISTGDYVLYEWDHRNRLTKVEYWTAGTPDTLAKVVEYDYDQADRRIARRVDEDADSTWDDEGCNRTSAPGIVIGGA